MRPTIETAAKICDTCGKPMNGSGYIGVRHPWCTHRIFERKRLARQRRNYARRKLNYDEAA